MSTPAESEDVMHIEPFILGYDAIARQLSLYRERVIHLYF